MKRSRERLAALVEEMPIIITGSETAEQLAWMAQGHKQARLWAAQLIRERKALRPLIVEAINAS